MIILMTMTDKKTNLNNFKQRPHFNKIKTFNLGYAKTTQKLRKDLLQLLNLLLWGGFFFHFLP
jgi:hypothetical protein